MPAQQLVEETLRERLFIPASQSLFILPASLPAGVPGGRPKAEDELQIQADILTYPQSGCFISFSQPLSLLKNNQCPPPPLPLPPQTACIVHRARQCHASTRMYNAIKVLFDFLHILPWRVRPQNNNVRMRVTADSYRRAVFNHCG